MTITTIEQHIAGKTFLFLILHKPTVVAASKGSISFTKEEGLVIHSNRLVHEANDCFLGPPGSPAGWHCQCLWGNVACLHVPPMVPKCRQPFSEEPLAFPPLLPAERKWASSSSLRLLFFPLAASGSLCRCLWRAAGGIPMEMGIA